MKLLFGLGNIGDEYTRTRHNLGWMTVEAFQAAHQGEPFLLKTKLHALVSTAREGNETVIAALPTTYMNVSGQALQSLEAFYHIAHQDILIVQDELDLPLGALRFTLGGGAGGHNGIRSIQERFPNALFARLRLGIGRPDTPQPIERYVLERFSSDEQPIVERVVKQAVEAIGLWRTSGLDAAIQTWNGTRA